MLSLSICFTLQDPAMRKRPIGILPITPEMEVSEYVQEVNSP